jgi:hypothetical protein
VFENTALKKLFVSNRDEVTGNWKSFHNEELHEIYYTTNITIEIKLRRIRWVGYMSCIKEKRIDCFGMEI